MKKIITFVLCLVMVIAVLPIVPITVGAEEVENGVVYSTGKSEARVIGCSKAFNDIEIKSEYQGLPVTSIAEFSFLGHTTLKTVKMPDTIKRIDDAAFSGCTQLSSINLSSSLESIGNGAFTNCSSLKSITIPDSVTSIGNSAFNKNTVIKCNPDSYAYNYAANNGLKFKDENLVVRITDGSAEICSCDKDATIVNIKSEYAGFPTMIVGNFSFSGCENLKSITLPDTINQIKGDAFYGCAGLTDVTIPENVVSIGHSAFSGCTGLTSITIPESVTSIGESAFYECTNLESAVIDAKITELPRYAFNNCTNLSSIILPESLESIGEFAITGTALKSIFIPQNVFKLERGCIADSSLEELKVDDRNQKLYSINNCVVERETKKLVLGIKNSVIPSDGTVVSIGDYAFYECNGLTDIVIPDGVTSIGTDAFFYCESLKNVKISDEVLDIGESAFYDCVNLKKVKLPAKLEVLKNGVFAHTGINEVVLPDTLKEIGTAAFYYCEGLKSIIIPDGVTKIGAMAFEGTGVEEVYLSKSLEIIEGQTFAGCTQLQSINIPASVQKIETHAFAHCTNLKSAVIPASVTEIGEETFIGCPNLTIFCYKESVAHNYAISNNISYEIIDCAALTGASVDVDSTLTLNCFAKPDEGMTDATKLRVKFTRNGKSIWADGVLNDNGKYQFAYEGITPQCMADIISIELYYGESKIDEKKYSIKEYCDTVAASSTTSLNISAQQFAKLKTMLADMLTYGSKAQVFANYNTSTLADSSEWVSKWVSQYVKPENIKSLSGSGDGARIGGAGLILENTVKIYYNITTDDAENVTAVLKRNGVTVLEKKVSQLNKANGVYRFVSNGISARNFNDKFELELYKNGEMVHSCTYSVNSYIAVMDGNAAVGELIKALGSYGKTALAYVNG